MAVGVSALPGRVSACLVPLCFGDEPEFHPNCTVVVRHRKRPICGATIRLSSDDQESSFFTDGSGSSELRGLAPGRYWIYVQHLGISGISHCVRISERPSKNAVRKKTYQWGDSPIEVQKVSVLLRDLQREEQKPLQSAPTFTPVRDARVVLRCAVSGATLTATTDIKGRSNFGYVPESVYVLSIEGGRGADGDPMPHRDVVLDVDSHYPDKDVVATRKLGLIDSCGDQIVLMASGR